MTRTDLPRLAALAQMVADERLARLRRAAAARAQSEAMLTALAPAPAPGMGLVADAMSEHRYQQWADARRAEINLVLARQTAEWMEARADAVTALGRREVLERLTQMQKK